jgi:leucyl aminopeptidase
MIPTSTRANLKMVKAIPGSVDAVAMFVHKQSKSVSNHPLLSQPEQETLDRLVSSGVFRGRSNEVTIHLMDGNPPRRLVIVGLGSAEKFSAECLREAGAAVAKAVGKHRISSVAILPPAIANDLPPVPGAKGDASGIIGGIEALVEGIVVGSFDYQEYRGAARKSADNELSKTIEFSIIGDPKQLGDAVDRGRIIAEGQNFARTIASRPGNNINPPSLAKVAQQLADELKLSARILDEKEMKRLGMGGILGVGSGSTTTPPRMIVLEYRGNRGGKDRPLLVVGKSITFDSGGISIKPADKMGRMIYDKSGGMAVLGLMYAVAKLKLPVHLVGILASAENILSATSYRPGDILHMYNGVTVDVTNTDAEGRLVLGDALAWGIETFKPAAVVDLATLTGGVVIALGKAMAGVMSNNDRLVDELTQASHRAGEKIWRLPIWDEHRDLMKGESADLVNSGPPRDASPLQGGAFLSFFVPWQGKDAIPWAHIDIAGVADTEKELPLYTKGSTGWGVRTMVEWIRGRASAT